MRSPAAAPSSRPCSIAASHTPRGRNGWPSGCLCDKHVLAVAGTHGKTTTRACSPGFSSTRDVEPGFLIGGVPSNFDATARLGAGPYFVIEADEYDTAFFDKRAKFVHYRPRTAILNNLEYDHADIYPDVASIRRQFNQLLRTVPASGRIVQNGDDAELAAVDRRRAAGRRARRSA